MPAYKYLKFFLILIIASCGREPNPTYLSDDSSLPKRHPSSAVIGDSVATGVFAATNVGVWPREIWGLVEEVISEFKFDTDREAIANRINEKAHKLVDRDNTDQRYATTNEDWGLASTIALKHQIPVKKVKRFLSAKFGATTRTAPALLEALLKQYNKEEAKDFRAGYVVVMLGANDFCDGLKPEEYAKKLKHALLATHKEHPESTLVQVSMPPILKIKDISCRYDVKTKIKVSAKALGAKDFILPGGVNCDDLRRSYCPTLYEDHAEGLVAEFQKQAESVYEDLRGQMDLRFARFHEAEISKEHLAFDGFHPNVEGQKLISISIREQLK